MEFISSGPFDTKTEEDVWSVLKVQFEDERGYCWHNFPVTGVSGQTTYPDLIIMHPEWGLVVIEIKGCSIRQIETIEGHRWYMSPDWYETEMTPAYQARNHMFVILDRLKEFRFGALRNTKGDSKIAGKEYVCLPLISESEWREKFGNHPSISTQVLLFSDQLNQPTLASKFAGRFPIQQRLPDEDWQTAQALIKGSRPIQNSVRKPAKPKTKANILRQVEERISELDKFQHKFAIQTPSGPQQLTGLAGTGKTVVLAQKAAFMHVLKPEWEIAYTFYTRALYSQIEELLKRFVIDFSNGEMSEPDWSKLKIVHSWGASNRDGLYRLLCRETGHKFYGFSEARDYFGIKNGQKVFGECCKELLQEAEIPELFDAILIDEGQDFDPAFYQMCLAALKPPKRVIYGYDVLQSLEDVSVPTPTTLFGSDERGEPIVSLEGTYPIDIEKEITLPYCYRNPRPVLIAAHAFGLGLVRPQGAVQFIDDVEGWNTIGYQVEGFSSGRLEPGTTVTIHRPKENSPHYIEELIDYNSLVSWRVFENRDAELDWIAEDVKRNIEQEGLRPDEIAVVTLTYANSTEELTRLGERLRRHGIKSVPLFGTSFDYFRVPDAVTLSAIHRAKGNEASQVYVYGFENVAGTRDLILKRNTAFTAMTRTKAWLELTGVGVAAETLFTEIEQILAKPGQVTFKVPRREDIQRNLQTEQDLRRRKKAQKAAKSISRTIEDLQDLDDLDGISPEKLEALEQLLKRKRQRDNK